MNHSDFDRVLSAASLHCFFPPGYGSLISMEKVLKGIPVVQRTA